MISGILFDKDGTLFDFKATWARFTEALLLDLAEGDADRAAALGLAVGYDLQRGEFELDSPVIAETPEVIAMALLPHLPGKGMAGLVAQMNAMSAVADLVQAAPLAQLLARLKGRGLKVGVATNDAEAAARAQLQSIGVADMFDFIAGFDSGHGGKPAPGMLLAFAQSCGLDPAEVLMVGDSRHDLQAGRAAGMRVIGVLTGPAPAAELAGLAETVLPDIGHLPDWLDRQIAPQSCA
ncbi:HAD family hydrolase [Thioclava sp. BHET1]|nr:HAD family hydrolase [Thioclava sp. BHET1]